MLSAHWFLLLPVCKSDVEHLCTVPGAQCDTSVWELPSIVPSVRPNSFHAAPSQFCGIFECDLNPQLQGVSKKRNTFDLEYLKDGSIKLIVHLGYVI